MKQEEIRLIITLAGKGTDPLPALLRQLYADCECYAQPGIRIFKPAPGILLQLCGLGAQPPVFLLNAPQPILAFKVDDLVQTIAIALAQGAELLERMTDDCTCSSSAHLRLADGKVIGYFE
jgi:hypothetical protein